MNTKTPLPQVSEGNEHGEKLHRELEHVWAELATANAAADAAGRAAGAAATVAADAEEVRPIASFSKWLRRPKLPIVTEDTQALLADRAQRVFVFLACGGGTGRSRTTAYRSGEIRRGGGCVDHGT